MAWTFLLLLLAVPARAQVGPDTTAAAQDTSTVLQKPVPADSLQSPIDTAAVAPPPPARADTLAMAADSLGRSDTLKVVDVESAAAVIGEALGVSEGEARAIAETLDALAEEAAEQEGVTKEDWYEAAFENVLTDGEVRAEALFELLASSGADVDLPEPPPAPHERRALLVGIDAYAPRDTAGALIPGSIWQDLDGAVNDAEAMAAILTDRYGFAEDDVRVLRNAEASRKGILDGVRQHLVQPSDSGDVALFYFAGRGSQVRNQALPAGRQVENTLVAADARDGMTDLRLSHLDSLFNALIDSAVTVTMILDHSHGGADWHGFHHAPTRYTVMDPRVIDDTIAAPPATERGALVLRASEPLDRADELVDEHGRPHGVLTWALLRALRTRPHDLPAADLTDLLRTEIRLHGLTQRPVLVGDTTARRRPLVAPPPDSIRVAPGAIVENVVGDNEIYLSSGFATGLRRGARLAYGGALEAGSSPTGTHVEMEVRDAVGPSQAVATIAPGSSSSSLLDGGFAHLIGWVPTSDAPIDLWMPPSNLSRQEIEQVALELQRISYIPSLRWVEDPTEITPTHIVYWDGREWRLRHPSAVEDAHLGTSPSAPAVQRLLPLGKQGWVRFFLDLPPFEELGASLRERLLLNDRAVRLVEHERDADYLLAGRMKETSLQYAWAYAPATAHTMSTGPITGSPWVEPEWDPYAEEQVYDDEADSLARAVRTFDTAWGWLQIEPPPHDGAFPYRVEGLRPVHADDSTELKRMGDTLRAGERYHAVLRADTAELTRALHLHPDDAPQRFVYLFEVNAQGDGRLLFPADGSAGSRIEVDDTSRTEIVLRGAGDGPLIEPGEPLGVHTLLLLATENPIPDVSLFEFEGTAAVEREPTPRGTPLSQLLYNLGHGRRTDILDTPLTWSLDRFQVRILPPAAQVAADADQ